MLAELNLAGLRPAGAIALGCLAGVVVLTVTLLIISRLSAGELGGLCFLLFWSAIVLLFDAFLSYGAVRQLLALSYPAVEGEVLHCELKSFGDASATSDAFNLEVAYEVQGRRYTGDCPAYFRMWSQPGARQFVAEHPAGSRCPVYYNPSDPADAVLVLGIEGDMLALDLFLTPFNLIMVGGWHWLIASFYRRHFTRHVLPVGARLFDYGTELRVRLPRVPPFAAAAVTAGLASFFAIFPIAFLCEFTPPPALALGVQGLILGAALVVYVLSALHVYSGKTDLVIDLLDQALVLPQTFGRKEPVLIPFSDLAAVDVVTAQTSGSNSSSLYAPTVRWHEPDGTTKEAKLAEWNDEHQAKDFAAWLREQVGLGQPSGRWGGARRGPRRGHEVPRRRPGQ
jgi:hypothetical protein